MMRKNVWLILCVVIAALSAYAGVGCSSGDGSKFGDGTDAGGDVDNDGPDFGDGACQLGCGDGSVGATPIILSPPNPTLTIINGAIVTQNFTATIDNKDVTPTVTWSYDSPLIGDVTSGSTFTPTGKVGGVGNLVAQLGKSMGTTTVSVIVQNTVITGVNPTQQNTLDNPNGGKDPSMSLVYPYNDTFFPLKVLSPEMMWNGTGNADVYKVVYKEKFYTLSEYFTTGAPTRHILDQKLWDSLELSGSGPKSDPLTVSVTRLSGSTAYQPITQTWHVVQGKLHGSVYYWELPGNGNCGNSSTGRILRIKPDSAVVDQFFTNNNQCWGCHTVSRDGNTVMASFNFPVSTIDVNKVTPTKSNCDMGQGTFSTFDTTGKFGLIGGDSFGSYKINLFDVVKCTQVKPDIFGAFGASGEPAWSPDGKHIAAITGGSGGGWFFDSSAGNITIADATGNTFSNFKTIVSQGKLPGGRPAYPSFDPTSQYITFGNPTQGSRTTAQGNLWLTDLTGKFKELKTGESINGVPDTKSFNSVFAPLRAGGYSWIVFVTRRDYGNRLVGQNNQQLWVMALDDPPSAADPSHPAFYMRGQEDCAKSENAYYALDPCKQKGQGCTSGVDCCSGQCIKQGGVYVCGDPTTNTCSDDGNKCTIDADCCGAPVSQCIDGFCQKPPPP